jgi:hypothetical protein
MKVSALLFCLLLTAIVVSPIVLVRAEPDRVKLLVVEYRFRERGQPAEVYAIPPKDDSKTNPDYKLLGFKWYATAEYWINPSNKYGFSVSAVVTAITASAETWDEKTKAAVFSYRGTTTRPAGKYDGYNVVAWGAYRAGVIAVTYILVQRRHDPRDRYEAEHAVQVEPHWRGQKDGRAEHHDARVRPLVRLRRPL